ncbi:MAG: DUF3089 domain-containing protein [Oscillospiraceae bacterium]|nr:DUF3089 domain-containing protein [Oscillospiraceae bacterium]
MKKCLSLLLALLILSTSLSAIAADSSAAPDYGDPASWAYFEMGGDKETDVFLICPTVDTQSETNSFDINEKLKAQFLYALDLEKGIYEDAGRLFSPYYRQMSMNAYKLSEAERSQAREIAYQDVSSAFRWYLDHENGGRPLILAGFSQGAEMCLELLKEYYGGDGAEAVSLRDGLVAVYAIGWSFTEEMTRSYPQIVPAQGETDTGVVISFDCEDGTLSGTIVNPAGAKALSINPLNWQTDSTKADKSLNHGAVMSTGAEPIPALCGAYIGERGEIVVTDVTAAEYPAVIDIFPDGSYHIYDYLFFFNNLKENVAARTAAYLGGASGKDAKRGDWYAEAVKYAYEQGSTGGTGDAALTRAQLAAILWWQAGKPAADIGMPFTDVEDGAWYARSICWAVENGVVNGFDDGSFRPNDPVTREQLAAMLYRDAQALGQGFRGAWMFLLDYPDADDVSEWADEAMHWVVMHEIITASDGNLNPQAYVTKDEISAVLQRWEDAVKIKEIDYLVLVNKLNPLPYGWEDVLETVTVTNSVGDEVEVEKKAYAAYELLKADLEKNDGIYVELDSARRSVAKQQEIMDRFTEQYGVDYAAKTVAQPGYSEHHTGLALDLYFRLKGADGTFTDVYYNEDMVQYPEIWAKIHAKLADYGYILRYLDGMEHITGYGYEPWHIRYVDDVDIAKEIMSQSGLTFEEYLAGERAPEVTVDYGASKLYTKEEMDEAMVQIKCRFAAWEGCELHSLRYAGDEANSAGNVKWMNELDEGQNYTQVVEFLSDFHSPVEGYGAWEPDMEYVDWQWWLARTTDGGWQLLTWGY